MSGSGEIIRRLVEGGANYESIGRAVGRNRSLIRQVGIGSKPGRNLEAALAELETRLGAVAPGERNRAARSAPTATRPAPRTTRRGALANVRRPVTASGANWSVSTVKKSAARSGARGLGHPIADAADAGRNLGVSVTVDRSVKVEASGSGGKSRRGRAGFGGTTEFRIEDTEDAWQAIREDYGGNVAEYLADHMLASGLVSGMGAADLAQHLTEIDIRSF